ncbi:MAG: tRNA pseudouridine(38-40) synthase TruA [Chloroflexota bacterium]
MARYKAIITYDGTEFSGMQRQLDARTVQGTFEQSLREIGWQGKSILAAGRTDAGVHANGQCVSFDYEWKHSVDDLLNAINSSLPRDVAAGSVNEVSEEFHPRYDAISRTYRYQINCVPYKEPLRERYYWRVWPKPDITIMGLAAEELLGDHDFSSFGTPPKEGGSTIRKVMKASWKVEDSTLAFEVEANGFLYHMVRRIVSQLVKIGLGKLKPEVVAETLSSRNSEMVQGLAPPNGLFLESVQYPPDR